jgi:hypothetical protein
MYHCVPSTISGLNQMLGLSFSDTMPTTAIGNSTLAGNAARNWAIGCARSAAHGRKPTHTPIGTQIKLAMAMSAMTRVSVRKPSPMAATTSSFPRFARR